MRPIRKVLFSQQSGKVFLAFLSLSRVKAHSYNCSYNKVRITNIIRTTKKKTLHYTN